MSNIKEKLKKGQNLSFEESKILFSELMEGKHNESSIIDILENLLAKGETKDELAGGIYILREKASKVNTDENTIDTCGTGGDGQNSLNISTAAAIVLASMGVKVAKHGNKAVSSNCGSADVLEALKININLSRKEAEENIKKGDIFQVVLSQRFERKFEKKPIEIYNYLRESNPSPFMFYFNFDDFKILGSSPEILVRLRNNFVTVRPIAGTRPRGNNTKQDKKLKNDLIKDKKELAEHLMLLDLGRNDVGKVSKINSVRVTESFKVEKYSHVMHIVSNVVGKFNKKVSSFEVLLAGFPAGTVSGAPKIRAMEIIDELEKNRRNLYAGGIGYFTPNNEFDTCIALRTALIKNNKFFVQAGAGIVADSKPEKEFAETVNKAKALMRAVD